MKYITSIFLLLISNILFAQTNQQSKKNPAIKVTPAINTTVIKQPSSMPNSNTNPTTGTVISLKTNKNTSKTNKPVGTAKSEAQLLESRTDTISSNSQNKSASHKKAAKKKK